MKRKETIAAAEYAYTVLLQPEPEGDPHLWKIEHGKLYLNLNQEIYETFLEDVDGNIEKADRNWPEIKHVAALDL
jgi:hypothetical protein